MMNTNRKTWLGWQRIAIIIVAIPCSSAYAEPIGVGAMGDSLVDEPALYEPLRGAPAFSWVELLARQRSDQLTFGAFTETSRGAPRYLGYEYN
jgi:hypothetical protein